MNIEVEWLYRRLGPRITGAVRALGSPVDERLRRAVLRRVDTVLGALFRYHGPRGILARTWATGSMVLWVAVLLWIYLLFYFAE